MTSQNGPDYRPSNTKAVTPMVVTHQHSIPLPSSASILNIDATASTPEDSTLYDGIPQCHEWKTPVSRPGSIDLQPTSRSFTRKSFQGSSLKILKLVSRREQGNYAALPDVPCPEYSTDDSEYHTADEESSDFKPSAFGPSAFEPSTFKPSADKPLAFEPQTNGIPWIWLEVLKVLLIIAFVFALAILEWYLIRHKS
jgi:hypothetical protein